MMIRTAEDEARRTRTIGAIVCSICKGYAWGREHEPVRGVFMWHHPACPNVGRIRNGGKFR